MKILKVETYWGIAVDLINPGHVLRINDQDGKCVAVGLHIDTLKEWNEKGIAVGELTYLLEELEKPA